MKFFLQCVTVGATVVAAERSLLASRGAVKDIPSFEQDHYYGSYESVSINQGGTNTDHGTCCDATAAQCKVQVISLGGDHWNDAAHNRSRDDTQEGQIVNWYHYKGHDEGKQMAITFNQTVNAYQCEQFCPLDGDMPKLEINKYALHLGKHEIKQDGQGGQTKSVDLYQWTDRLVVIPLDQTKFYVDESVNPPVPFFENLLLEPFGEKIGTENTSYLGFTPGPVDQTKFNIVGIEGCPKGDNCNDNSYATPALKLKKSFLKAAEEKAAQATATVEKSTPLKDAPVFASDWSAHETAHLVINQGGVPDASGALCCAHAVIGQCQVQTEYQQGQKYFDFSNNRTRFEDEVSGEIIVNDYIKGMEMSVVHNETLGYDVCQEYCPLQDELEVFGIDPDAKDEGASTDPMSGKAAEHYHWADVILKIIQMSHTEFYADISGDKAIPLSQQEHLTPFGGPEIGSSNNTWANFTEGAQPASKFDIHGVDTCPESPNCGQQSRQLHRLSNRDYKTFAKYLKTYSQ